MVFTKPSQPAPVEQKRERASAFQVTSEKKENGHAHSEITNEHRYNTKKGHTHNPVDDNSKVECTACCDNMNGVNDPDNAMDGAVNDKVNAKNVKWHVQRPNENKESTDSTLYITKLDTIDKAGDYIFHLDITYQKVSDTIKIDPIFDASMIIGQPIAKRSQNLSSSKIITNKKHDDNVSKKEIVALVCEENTITKKVEIHTEAEDDIIPVIADSQTLVECAVFPAELATTICTNGLMFQLRQGILVQKVHCSGSSRQTLTKQVIFDNKNMRKHASEYTMGQIESQKQIHMRPNTCQ